MSLTDSPSNALATRYLPPLGELHQDDQFPDWWVSRLFPVPLFSGTPLEFIVTVDAVAAGYPPDVVEAVQAFLSLGDADRFAASNRVCDYHREIVESASRLGLMELLQIEPHRIEEPRHIWRFVKPTEVCIDRRDDHEREVYITIGCECTWEPEHGLQLVYRRGMELVRVSAQDGHLL